MDKGRHYEATVEFDWSKVDRVEADGSSFTVPEIMGRLSELVFWIQAGRNKEAITARARVVYAYLNNEHGHGDDAEFCEKFKVPQSLVSKARRRFYDEVLERGGGTPPKESIKKA